MTADGQILQQSTSYRRGLVLGLTMAEIMVLLIFSLLIAMATILSKEEAARKDAEKRLKQEEIAAAADHALVESIKQTPRLAELLKKVPGSGNSGMADKFWRDLVESKGLAAAARSASFTKANLEELSREGITGEKALRDASIVRAAERAMPGKVTEETITGAIRRSEAPEEKKATSGRPSSR